MKLYNKLQTKDLRRQLRKDLTKEERKIWNVVRNRKILELKFFRQYSIGKYILDFYCPAIRLCIEVDGGQHNEEADKTYDQLRTDYLKFLNIKVIRFWNNEVNNNIEGVYQVIYNASEEQITNSPQPSL
jgi:very-short-patch-repair endonuclease